MSPTDSSSSRRRIALIAAATVTTLVGGIGLYGLATGPHTPPPPATSTSTTSPGPSTPGSGRPSTSVTAKVPPVAASRDPEQFARNVATTLFAWDTTTGLMPLDYTSAILAVGDPSGTEQAGLATDVAAYLPSRTAWHDLRTYATRQHLTIDRIYVPDAWGQAVAQAPKGAHHNPRCS